MRCCRLISALVALTATALAPLDAQSPDSAQFRCDGRVITSIEIEPQPPAIIGRDPSTLRRAAQHFLFQSGTTRQGTIRPFILTHVGERCDDRTLSELARVIRAQPYLAAVTVHAERDSADGVRLLVETVDEVPLIIGGGVTHGGLSNVKYGNSNIGGSGLLASGQWRQGHFCRDAYSLSMRQYGLLDQPVVATLDAQRALLGSNFSIGVTRPFLSDLEHIGWYVGGMHDNAYRSFVRHSEPALLLPVARDIWSVGAVARYPWRGGGAMIGPVATYE
ncbi:MAG TPA: hypothetical protein VGP84_21915, partial [Gemmatimonadaceae bacterium]|nr:hypothetical protein [Gemmatimonadaceae bacterium]